MKHIACSIFDTVTSTYREPFYAANEADAKRAFKYIMSQNKMMSDNPSDYELFNMGCFDDEVGYFVPVKEQLHEYGIKPIRMFKGGEVFHEQINTGDTL